MLKQYLNQKKQLKEKEAFVFVFQTCIALDYLHKKSIIHCDINPQNMFLTHDGNIKLTGFGLSIEQSEADNGRNKRDQLQKQCLIPEMILNESFDFRADLWSVGALLFEMLHGYPPYKTKEEVLQGNLKFSEISLEAKNLIFSLLQQNPGDRLELLSIFNDTWMMQHQQEFKIDFNQYLYKPSKTPPSSHKKSTHLESSNTPVKTLKIDPIHENPFTTPPKMSPLSNRKKQEQEASPYRETSQNEFISKPESNLEMSFQEEKRNSRIGESSSVRRSNNHQDKKRLVEENGSLFESSPQKQREKENIIDNPELAREWLDSRKADKDLDYSFMPKSLVYSYKTIDQSYMELKRKTQQLETMMGEQEQDQDFGRVSRSSWKNVQDDTPGNENLLNNKEVNNST